MEFVSLTLFNHYFGDSIGNRQDKELKTYEEIWKSLEYRSSRISLMYKLNLFKNQKQKDGIPI